MNDTTNLMQSIDALDSFLRGERSAVETYRQALDVVAEEPIRTQLFDCLRSHEERVSLLETRIIALGGKPSEGSGPWGAFARLVEGGAKLFGIKAAIAALEEGEDHGLNDYRRDLGELDADSRRLIEEECLPEQRRTHAVVSSLKHGLH